MKQNLIFKLFISFYRRSVHFSTTKEHKVYKDVERALRLFFSTQSVALTFFLPQKDTRVYKDVDWTLRLFFRTQKS
jgi:hypothetical protein